jgi:hypothetical protein
VKRFKSLLRVVLVIVTATVGIGSISGCATNAMDGSNNTTNNQEVSVKRSQVACTDPRPLMCTREFAPVCALKQDLDGNKTQVTYATGCTACADPQVLSYEQGACQQ